MTKQKLKMPVKTQKYTLNGDYEGFEFTARLNWPVGLVEYFNQNDPVKVIEGLSQVIVSWNFPDENGDLLGSPNDVEVMKKIPDELLGMMFEKIQETLVEQGKVPSGT